MRRWWGGVTAAQSRWRPNEEEWSILEVVNHLYDEEQYDFRVRLDIILHHPQRPWPKIDPQSWVGHDLLHLRQLVELHWAYTVAQLAPYHTRYAGEW